MKRTIGWPIIILISALVMGIVSFTRAPFRPAVAFWFLMVCPGMAFVQLLHLKEWVMELTLAIAMSIAINIIVSETMVLAGIWSPKGGLLTIICITMLGAIYQIIAANGRKSKDRQ